MKGVKNSIETFLLIPRILFVKSIRAFEKKQVI